MGLDVLDIVFFYVGKLTWLGIRKVSRSKKELSQGAYEAFGLVLVVLIGVLIFFIWGALNV